MGYLSSPGIQVLEQDESNIVPANGSATGAFVGYFNWGPCGVPTAINSEEALVSRFGRPGGSQAVTQSFLQVTGFCDYASTIVVARANNASLLNATNTGVGVGLVDGTGAAGGISTTDEVEALVDDVNRLIVARYGGEYGNSITAHIVTNANYDAVIGSDSRLRDALPYKPTTTE